MSSSGASSTTTRTLSGRQSDRIAALVEATLAELRTHGYDGLTVRNAARRAGVAPATAYTYFGSKDHLVAEVFWRRLDAVELPVGDRRRRAATRVSGALRAVVDLIAGEPELASASTTAILADDADVQRLRDRIGGRIDDLLSEALGSGHDPAVRRALNLALSGALLQAGMGYFSYADLADRMDEVVGVILGSGR
ncbi:MAG TPA: helix-turn-helix domain-containing protein [Acidimicrobiales bacterium]